MRLASLLLLSVALCLPLTASAQPVTPKVDLVFDHAEASASYSLGSGEIVFSEAATTTDLTVKEFTTHATRRMVIDSASYINPTGLIANASSYVNVKLLNGSTVLANWSTQTGQEGALTADTWVSMTLNSTAANLILPGGTVLSVFTDWTAGGADAGVLNDHSLGAGKVLVRYHYIPAAGSASVTTKIYKAALTSGRLVIDSVQYLNATGLAAHSSNYFTVALKDGTTTVASWSTLTTAQGTITGGTPVSLVMVDAARVVAPGDVLNMVLTESGTAVLPAGRLIVHGHYHLP